MKITKHSSSRCNLKRASQLNGKAAKIFLIIIFFLTYSESLRIKDLYNETLENETGKISMSYLLILLLSKTKVNIYT